MSEQTRLAAFQEQDEPSIADNPLSLRVLPLENVNLHEQVDPERVDRLIGRLQQDMILKNPPIVAEWQHNYVVLDGATRVTALRKMGFPHVVAQVVQNDGSVELDAWNHIKQGIEAEQLCHMLQALPQIVLRPTTLELIDRPEVEGRTLCYLVLSNRRTFTIEAAVGSDPLEALNLLVEAYLEDGYVDRSKYSQFEMVKREYPRLSGLFVYPKFNIEQVLTISQDGKRLPAGITRFVIPGRVLRLNFDLERLRSDDPLPAKAHWLDKRVATLIADHRVRYYQEPIYLLDE